MKPVRLEFIFTGGCGTNNARTIIDALNLKEYAHLGLMVINTDTPQLKFLFSPSEDDSSLRLWLDSGQLFILQLGESGNGVGGKPEIGEQTTRDQLQQIKEFLVPLDAVILVGGGGGGTGSGAMPVVASKAKELSKPVLSIITMPPALSRAAEE